MRANASKENRIHARKADVVFYWANLFYWEVKGIITKITEAGQAKINAQFEAALTAFEMQQFITGKFLTKELQLYD